MQSLACSTPSRLCLFGEHQDYLGLEVIALAVNLRFGADVAPRADGKVNIRIRDEKNGDLNGRYGAGYEEKQIDLSLPIVYDQKRDYLKSVFNVLLREGYDVRGGFDITMNSDIPIGKGMCSSSTMIVVLIKALLEAVEHPDAGDPARVAQLSFLAEVAEFQEPGGMMDHYTSAVGGLVHLDFSSGTRITPIDFHIPGSFILVDTLARKNTTQVLGDSKLPMLEALDTLRGFGVAGIRELAAEPDPGKYIDRLDEFHAVRVRANLENYKLQRRALAMLRPEAFDPELFGRMLREHHGWLRDGMRLSTPAMERIFDHAYENGALGGKLNGSGGGGCLYLYAMDTDAERLTDAITELGYPSRLLKPDGGARVDKNGETQTAV